MAININTIYQRVLDTANKEQRGYITPKEFNVFADQAQMEIFDSYFYDSEVYGRTRPNDTEHSDRHDIIQEKIEFFEKEIYGHEIAYQPDGFRRYLMYTPDDFYKIQTVLVAINPNNQISVDTFLEGENTGRVSNGLILDDPAMDLEYQNDEDEADDSNRRPVYGPTAFEVAEAEYVSKKQLISVMGNSLTRPTMRRPIYTFEGRHKDFIRVFGKDNYPNNYRGTQKYFLDPSFPGHSSFSDGGVIPGDGRSPRFRDFDHNGVLDSANISPELLIISYIRKPRTPRWAYIENRLGLTDTSYPIYNAALSQDFELHPSEGSNLTNKILELSGIKLKQGDISQVGRIKVQEKSQIRKQ